MIFTNYYQKLAAMYKTRNTRTGHWMRGMGRMFYSGECCQTFRGMSPNILGNFVNYSGKFRQTSRGMPPNISGNVAKHIGEWGNGNEDAGSVQDFILFFCVWCKLGEFADRVSPRFPYLTSVVECLPSDLLQATVHTLTTSTKNLHRRFSTKFQIRLQLEVL